jgi:hypothetical protein
MKLLLDKSGSAIPDRIPGFSYPWAFKSRHNTGAAFCMANKTVDPNA